MTSNDTIAATSLARARSRKADAAALSVLAVVMLTGGLLTDPIHVPLWAMGFAWTTASGIYCWNHPKAPHLPQQWLWLAVKSVLVAPVLYGFMAVASILVSESEGSRVFNAIIALMICPGGTSLALLGWIRAKLLRHLERHIDAS